MSSKKAFFPEERSKTFSFPEELNMAKETGSARSGEHVDTQHLENMTPKRSYVTKLNAASRFVYTLAARTIATQSMAVSRPGCRHPQGSTVPGAVRFLPRYPQGICGVAPAFQRTGLHWRGKRQFQKISALTSCPSFPKLSWRDLLIFILYTTFNKGREN